jgi:hypothetical protein
MRVGVTFGLSVMVVAALALPAFGAPIGPNPYPAVSQSVCENTYGGSFSGGGNDKTCIVSTSVSATFYHALAQIGKGGGWTITSVTNTTYNITNGVRDTQASGFTSCVNPGGKTMTNDWIRPCLPSSYPYSA